MSTSASVAVPTVGDAIERILARLPERISGKTIDTVKHGDVRQPLRGVAVTFMATRSVLGYAVDLGANLIVTHEPTFYNHLDETAWLAADPVYRDKLSFLTDHQLVVWRVHDHLHCGWPDLIAAGVLAELGWSDRVDPLCPGVVTLEPQSLAAVVSHVKQRLNISVVKIVGSVNATCSRIAVLPGAAGGRRQIDLLSRPDVDVMVCGESPEWETCEYVRDALTAGISKALIVLGHANSEEAGMAALAAQMRSWLPPGTRITHVPAGDPFRWL